MAVLPLACETCGSIFLRPLKEIFESILCEFASLLQHNEFLWPSSATICHRALRLSAQISNLIWVLGARLFEVSTFSCASCLQFLHSGA